ncbi:MAG: P-loop NTPase [Actinobacteria bacterium]|nr:P-loop NTPase [Actinomycetota bacterium]
MPHTHVPRNEPLPGIGHIIAVASGKGGVGKSTVAVNLALALARSGRRVGLVDTDVLGPSIPGMLGLSFGEPPQASPEGKLLPTEVHGLKAVSMGLLRSDDEPAIMRGPMVTKYLQMFLAQVAWGELDHLVLDLPPGTGDTQLTLAQSVQLTGAVIVTTPQDVSLKIARRGLRMFEKVSVPILGIVENMGTFTCPHCGTSTDIFSHGGGSRMSRELGVPFLGSLPLDPAVVDSGDSGMPIVAAAPESVSGLAYRAIAEALEAQIDGRGAVGLRPFQWQWDSGEGAPDWVEVDPGVGGAREAPAGMRARDARTLTIGWSDGRVDDIDVRDLRLACPCAYCVEEMSGAALLDPASVPADVAPRRITSVGTYAVIIDWSDGHGTGIYTFTYLRKLAEHLASSVSEEV